MTITQTVEIPASRLLTIEIPSEIPEGKARLEMKVIPFAKEKEKPEPPLKCLIGIDTSLVDSLVGIISNQENKTYDELRVDALMGKYEEYLK